jgi:hypothetical protein
MSRVAQPPTCMVVAVAHRGDSTDNSAIDLQREGPADGRIVDLALPFEPSVYKANRAAVWAGDRSMHEEPVGAWPWAWSASAKDLGSFTWLSDLGSPIIVVGPAQLSHRPICLSGRGACPAGVGGLR